MRLPFSNEILLRELKKLQSSENTHSEYFEGINSFSLFRFSDRDGEACYVLFTNKKLEPKSSVTQQGSVDVYEVAVLSVEGADSNERLVVEPHILRTFTVNDDQYNEAARSALATGSVRMHEGYDLQMALFPRAGFSSFKEKLTIIQSLDVTDKLKLILSIFQEVDTLRKQGILLRRLSLAEVKFLDENDLFAGVHIPTRVEPKQETSSSQTSAVSRSHSSLAASAKSTGSPTTSGASLMAFQVDSNTEKRVLPQIADLAYQILFEDDVTSGRQARLLRELEQSPLSAGDKSTLADDLLKCLSGMKSAAPTDRPDFDKIQALLAHHVNQLSPKPAPESHHRTRTQRFWHAFRQHCMPCCGAPSP